MVGSDLFDQRSEDGLELVAGLFQLSQILQHAGQIGAGGQGWGVVGSDLFDEGSEDGLEGGVGVWQGGARPKQRSHTPVRVLGP
ncbi:hypothetical protein, partial [Saccharomonospora viridis]|uniref:hypothetical protein n=1 Tax=Saccharomonospora viridis TaxID=1852 RepID=UPI0005646A05